ncbi:kinesin-like protein KIF16B isoform X4 [Prionailurus bengalensis]|uniref:kinesin-like protein KIF16B isoform X4 n=1 Tax=Prionailurus bengalensis TaxID=37029 RepID=UPI001CA9F09C|nr:kinesin-like protein KIF16B isoform X4 [Prionailurus bengalensis]
MASVKVAVRVRPMNRREKDLEAKFIIQMEKSKTTITNLKIPEGGTGDSGRERTKTFTYDFSFYSADTKSPDYVSQEMVFNTLGTDVVKSAFEGYNACVFAYGQTGSGKSYTMMGNSGDSGLIPRICEGLFSQINETTRWDEASFRTEVSYLEIYNERVRDLLRRKSSKTFNLRVREHPKEGPYVEDLSKHLVQNYGDVEELMDAGNINRTTAATGMNDVSSRSHAIFTIKFTQAKFDSEMPSETVSKIHLVDLAGSERADATGATGVRLKEGGNINKSLVTLGNVISALADLSQDAANPLVKKKQVFVPYRDSVLTWLLKDSLGGNSKTIMIATISPADVNYGETLSTLRYANRAKNIINKPTINEDANVKLIRELRAEIARLKTLLAQGNQIALLDSPTALSMEEKLQQNEARVQELTKEWTNKWNETQNILKEQTLALRKEGIGVVLDSELPHLIGIDDDLLSTGIILYHLKEGQTYVGREDASTEQDIVLHGLDLESEHCIFENVGGTVTLIPLSGSQCSVNGVQIMEATHLNQGAVILLGRTNMFRFNHPKEAAKLREKRKSGLLSSFSLSMTDLSKSCENLSTVMLYNPGLEFERQQREELEKLESKRLEHEIQQLKQKICEVDGVQKGHRGTMEGKAPSSSLPSSAEKSHLVPLMDARISAYIEEEVQRRLQDLHRAIGEDSSASADVARDNEKLHNGTIQRKLKYEKRYLAPLLPRDVTGPSGREEGREVERNNHPGPPTTQSISASPAPSSASYERAHQRRHRSSVHKVWQNSDRGYGHPECAGCFQPKRFSLPEITFLNESNTSDTKHQHRSKHLNDVMTHKDKHNLRIESSWTLLQDLSQEVPLHNGSKQTRQSKLLCLVLSETVSGEEGASHSVPQHAPAGKFCGEQQVERELDAKKANSPQSLINIRTEGNSGLGYFYHRLADLYKDTSSHLLQAGTEVIRQAGHIGNLCDPRGLTSHVTTFIRRLPFLKHFPLATPLRSQQASSEPYSFPREAQAGSRVPEEAGAARPAEGTMPFRASGLTAASAAAGSPDSSASSVLHLESDDSGRRPAFKQTLVRFPAQMLKLQEQPLKDFLEHVACSVPELSGDIKEVKGVYWLAVANCTEPDPQPACLLLLHSMLYALVLSDNPSASMGIFHALPLSGLEEIQVGFGGQSIRLLGSAESLLLTVFSYSKTLCQQICSDLLCVLMPESDAAVRTNHPLFQQDLVQLSLDWKAEIPDLVLADGVRLSSRFQDTLVDMIYFLHGNMEVNIPSLAEVQLLLYTTVRVEGDPGQDNLQSLVLLNTHIALLREDRVFYPHTQSLNTPSPRAHFDVTRCRALSEFRYVVIPEKETLSTIQLVFPEKLRLPSDSKNSPAEHFEGAQNVHLFPGMPCPEGSQNVAPEVWKLTLSSQDEALWLIAHLTRLSGGNL